MTLSRWLGAGAALLAVVVLLVVLVGGDDDGGSSASQQTQSASDGSDGDGEGDGGDGKRQTQAFDGPEGRAGAKAVGGLYAGLSDAVDLKIEPLALYVNPRIALDKVQGVEPLTRTCNLLSDQAREDTVRYARELAGFEGFEWTCEKAMALMLRNSKINHGLARTLQVKVVGVNVNGDQGTATLSHGKGRPLSTVPIVKQDGEWKIGASPAE